ncbi:MAG: hypothetical protein AAF146_25610, partial [Bacteroidota bacterium]
MKLSYSFFLLLLLACHSTGQPSPTSTETTDLPSPDVLRQSLRTKRSLTLVYGTGPSEAAYRQLAEEIAAATDYLQIQISSAAELDAQRARTDILFLLGSPQTNTWITRAAKQLPLRLDTSTLRFAERDFTAPNTLLQFSAYPSPFNPQLPLYLLTGFDDRILLRQLRQWYGADWSSLVWAARGYKVFEGATCQVMGFFQQPDWQIGGEAHWDFRGSRDTIHRTPHFEFINHRVELSRAQVEEMGKRCEGGLSEIEDFCGRPVRFDRIRYHLYPSGEEKGLLLFNTQQSHLDWENGEVHTVISAEYQDNFVQQENELILRHLLGEASQPFLEDGLGVYFAHRWQREGYAYWAQRLFQSGNALPLAELLDRELYERESKLVKTCTAGALVEFLIAHWGKNGFLEKYNKWSPSPTEVAELAGAWDRYRQQRPTLALPDRRPKADYWRGFNFAHEGYQIYNGYLSKGARESLGNLQALGSNAIAIVPYSYLERPDQPGFLPFMNNPGTETDESVIHVAHAARALGLQSLLKPQVWLGRGSWSGFVEMKTEREWALFFDYYYRWIRHYALLAEIHEIEALSVGVEFGRATLGHEAEWVQIFRKLRDLYRGQLTYCANWGEEFEQLDFWQELDFIGLNCYYPL